MRRSWLPAALALAMGATALAVVLVSNRPSVQRLDLPAPGEAVAALAPSGRPLWVIAHVDGSVSVLDAFSTHSPYRINKTTWWCPDSRSIEDPGSGALFDEGGAKIFGPAPSGLRAYPAHVEGGQIVVDGAPEPRPVAEPAEASQDRSCRPPDAVVHDFSSLALGESPIAAATSEDGRWQRVFGTLIPRPELGSAQLCGTADGAACTEIVIPEMADYRPFPGDGFGPDPWTDASWLVRAEDGAIVEIAQYVPPD